MTRWTTTLVLLGAAVAPLSAQVPSGTNCTLAANSYAGSGIPTDNSMCAVFGNVTLEALALGVTALAANADTRIILSGSVWLRLHFQVGPRRPQDSPGHIDGDRDCGCCWWRRDPLGNH